MKKLHCVICGKYRKFETLKMSYTLEKTSIEILKILGLIENI